MSTPGGTGPSDGKDMDRRRSLGKYVKRMSSVFKREKSTTTASTSTASAAPATTPATVESEQKEPTKEIAASAPAASTTAEETTPTPKATVSSTTTPPPPVITTHQINRSALQQERARLLFAKYGLTLESHEWLATPAQPISVQRVERPIRMRVHRECHHCGTSFGAEKVCTQCEHKRCKKCPRYPKKKTAAEKGKGKDGERERLERPKKKKQLLTVTTKTGEERIYQPVKQRIRRSCHKCNTLFIPATSTTCEQCSHVRCTKCPREPAKLAKWPHGYPGDVEPDSDNEVDYEKDLELVRRIWRKPRTRVRWECEECQAHFIEGQPQCPGCGHERCEKCTRTPAKKAKKESAFDPEVVRQVEAKLRALAVEQGNPLALGREPN
ncbi:hypothetical protein B0J11DRAFT_251420 [Dendryphion nanum]|uniref:Uncharacterized protein n=1 Tax=Dendryphion nanum TaxID=256645 RepID=A0A9P9IPN7_9PLEO|nr:hypothetical protein B0J11DRAFT_251420 [Dendryphion nanum]